MGVVNTEAKIEKLVNVLGIYLLEQGAYYVEYGNSSSDMPKFCLFQEKS